MRTFQLHPSRINKSTSKKAEAANLHVHRAISYLQALDAAQEKNPAVTIVAHAGDGVWVHYGEQRLFQTHPHTNYLRFIVWPETPKEAQQLAKRIDRHLSGGSWFEDITRENHYRQWRAGDDGIALVEEFVRALPYEEPDSEAVGSHPRTFPGEVREQALAEFEAGGSRCPGVPTRDRKPHKVDLAH